MVEAQLEGEKFTHKNQIKSYYTSLHCTKKKKKTMEISDYIVLTVENLRRRLKLKTQVEETKKSPQPM